jgi:hypothetical protein
MQIICSLRVLENEYTTKIRQRREHLQSLIIPHSIKRRKKLHVSVYLSGNIVIFRTSTCMFVVVTILFLCIYSPIQTLAASMKLYVSLQLPDLGKSVGILGRVISSSQGFYLYTNTEKRTHDINIKHPCPEWDWNPWFRRPRDRRQFMP